MKDFLQHLKTMDENQLDEVSKVFADANKHRSYMKEAKDAFGGMDGLLSAKLDENNELVVSFSVVNGGLMSSHISSFERKTRTKFEGMSFNKGAGDMKIYFK